jgi:hypothetical protein
MNQQGSAADTLLAHADVALYTAKRGCGLQSISHLGSWSTRLSLLPPPSKRISMVWTRASSLSR